MLAALIDTGEARLAAATVAVVASTAAVVLEAVMEIVEHAIVVYCGHPASAGRLCDHHQLRVA